MPWSRACGGCFADGVASGRACFKTAQPAARVVCHCGPADQRIYSHLERVRVSCKGQRATRQVEASVHRAAFSNAHHDVAAVSGKPRGSMTPCMRHVSSAASLVAPGAEGEAIPPRPLETDKPGAEATSSEPGTESSRRKRPEGRDVRGSCPAEASRCPSRRRARRRAQVLCRDVGTASPVLRSAWPRARTARDFASQVMGGLLLLQGLRAGQGLQVTLATRRHGCFVTSVLRSEGRITWEPGERKRG